MQIEECVKLVEELICTINDIVSKGALMTDTQSLDQYRDVYVQMTQLIRTLFPDADQRLRDYEESRDVAASRDGSSDKRTSFIEQAKATRRYLISIKDSLRLRGTVELKEGKLDRLRREVGEKEVEAERREKVAETKFYGAFIEIIDRLRDQIRTEGDTKQEILRLQNGLFEIKESFAGTGR